MKWIHSCLQNQLTIYLTAIAVCLLGLFCLSVISIAPFPPIQMNDLQIQFSYPGANAETVQSEVTDKVQNALRALNNVLYMHAVSQTGSATITLMLESMKPDNLLQTEIGIQQAVASSGLPSVVQQPTIQLDTGESSLIAYMLYSDEMSLFDINRYIQAVLFPKFSSLPGVSVYNVSQNDAVVKIQLNPEKIAQYQLNVGDLTSLLNLSDQSNPLGQMYLHQNAYSLNLSKEIHSLTDFRNLIVGYQNQNTGQPIYLKDIAKVSFTSRSVLPQYYYSYEGHTADKLALFTASTANPFQISDAAEQYVQAIKKNLPQDMQIRTVFDMAKVMRGAFNDLLLTVCIAAILVLLIALIFLGHLRTTLIPIITVPICLLGATMVITLLGFTFNILTLIAMVIAVGLVVDDAIVVVENITRHLEEGMNKMDAVLHGTADIAKTILGITFTLLAVYLPIAFCNGTPFIVLLKAFAVPLAASVFISGMVALTLTPAMCVHLVSDAPPNAYQIQFAKILHAIIRIYQAALKKVLNAPFFSLTILALLIVIGGYFALKQPQEFFPSDPNDRVLLTINGSGQDTIESLHKKLNLFSQFYHAKTIDFYTKYAEIDPLTGNLSATVFLQYAPQYLTKNALFTDQINQFIKKNNIQNAFAKLMLFLTTGGDGSSDLSFYIYNGSDIEKVNAVAQRLTDLMKRSPLFLSATNTIHQPKVQLQFDVDSVKAAQLGIYRPQLMNVLSTFYGGYTLNNYFNIAGLSVPVLVQMDKKDLQDPTSLEKLEIQSPKTQKNYPLDDLVSIKLVAKPDTISTFNNESSVEIDANFAKGYSFSEAIPYLKTLLQKEAPGFSYQFTGNAETFLQGNNDTLFIVILGILCIYFLLAILFESLADPFIILLTVPFSVIGGALSLYVVQGSINLFSTMGLITLIGLITKHGVLIVQFANQQIEKGESTSNAILLATHHRFRPIMMTTLAMTLGALPLVFNHQLMYVAKQDLGSVIIGGLLIGTVFSLFIVPLVYSLIKRAERR